ncbi:hypothetical protein [uncultured Roseobacter sp.]|uniref:hypothetical protein n=1 Tax=uncultured Roseobacter sp. TaxID=114847 RepID=UPI0026048C29|nr:hypothetical protein [uncultured Roseobacter sp.]
MTSISMGIGLSSQSNWVLLETPGGGPAVRISLLENGTAEIEANGGGQVTITVAGSASYDGEYLIDTADLASGPINLVPPALSGSGTTAAGDTLPLVPGLWVYGGGDIAPTISYFSGSTNAVDASNPAMPTLLVDVADAGTVIAVSEQAAGVSGTRTAASNSVPIAAPPLEIDLVFSGAGSGSSTSSYTFPGATLGAADADRELYIATGGFRTGSSSSNVFNVTVGGVSATRVAEVIEAGSNLTVLNLHKVAVPVGTTADIVVSLSAGSISQSRIGIQVARVLKTGGTTVTDVATANVAQDVHPVDVETVDGGFALAAAFKSGNTTQPTITGLTARGTPYVDIDSGEFLSIAFDVVTTTGTRSINTRVNEVAPGRHIAAAIAFE